MSPDRNDSAGHDSAGHGAAGRHAASHDYTLPRMPDAVDIFDTTLRDGSQQEGLSLTVDDKLRVAEQLDHLGVAYIEGGWPGANPKDEEFFARAPAELQLSSATLVAFGSTRRSGVRPEDDEVLRHLIKANTEAVCIVAKASELHVTEALRTSLDEALAMASDSVAYLRSHGLRVFFDAEHFFDGYRDNPEFSLEVLRRAAAAGAETLVLCDTNGGTLPHDVERIVATVTGGFETQVGVHFHNDSGCAVANSIAAVRAGASHVQGCINGYGERTGNCNLTSVIPLIHFKMKKLGVPANSLPILKSVSAENGTTPLALPQSIWATGVGPPPVPEPLISMPPTSELSTTVVKPSTIWPPALAVAVVLCTLAINSPPALAKMS